jgi:hypothetical protein
MKMIILLNPMSIFKKIDNLILDKGRGVLSLI